MSLFDTTVSVCRAKSICIEREVLGCRYTKEMQLITFDGQPDAISSFKLLLNLPFSWQTCTSSSPRQCHLKKGNEKKKRGVSGIKGSKRLDSSKTSINNNRERGKRVKEKQRETKDAKFGERRPNEASPSIILTLSQLEIDVRLDAHRKHK